ncbi:hypothetical protein RJ639_023169, partial [Escallonia herrerae]
MVVDNAFAKTICSICYEDLKPIVEDLQSISICGHVFHELWSWFEYCSNGKKKNCPVCKQTCSEANVARLYFQSFGDQNDLCASQSTRGCFEDPKELQREVKRLERKAVGLNTVVENQQKELNAVNEELCNCKKQLKLEVMLKNNALEEKAVVQQLLHLKSEELNRSTSERVRLQERNMALAKELAALKLVSDLNLEEEDVLKLASLGKEGNNHKETIDILRKSLVIRNKSYKELMAKCNALGRGEARSLTKLEKANEKLKKLKTRVQELETVVEVKENEDLRAFKASKITTCKLDASSAVDHKSNSSYISKCLVGDQTKKPAVQEISSKRKRFSSSNHTDISNTKNSCIAHDQDMSSCILIDGDVSEIPSLPHGSGPEVNEDLALEKCSGFRQGVASDTKNKALVHGPSYKDEVSGSRNFCEDARTNTAPAYMDEDLVSLRDNTTQDQPLPNIRKEIQSPVPNDKETSTLAKKCKYGARAGGLQSQGQGRLQIEHFFGRA